MLLQTIRSLVVLCDSELLERNLEKFSATWQSAIASASSLIHGITPRSNFPLAPTDYGALVDVVDAVISNLPDPTVARLFDVFLRLLRETADGLAKIRSTPQLSNSKDPPLGRHSKGLPGSPPVLAPNEAFKKTLQCLLKRAYKGLKHICERVYRSIGKDETHGSYDELKTSEKLLELWQVREATVLRKIWLNATDSIYRSWRNPL